MAETLIKAKGASMVYIHKYVNYNHKEWMYFQWLHSQN